jgi:hypothetical protein
MDKYKHALMSKQNNLLNIYKKEMYLQICTENLKIQFGSSTKPWDF